MTCWREPGPGRIDVAGKGEGAGAEVHGGERLTRHPQQVDHRAHAGDVLEVQVRRIVEVDVRLRGAVDLELPPAGVLGAHHVRERAVGEPHGRGGLLESGAGHGSTLSRTRSSARGTEFRGAEPKHNRDRGVMAVAPARR